MASSAACAHSTHPNIDRFLSCGQLTLPSWAGNFTMPLERQDDAETTDGKVSLVFRGIGGPDELDQREITLELTLLPPDYNRGTGKYVVKYLNELGSNRVQTGNLTIRYNEKDRNFNLEPGSSHRRSVWPLSVRED